MKVVLAGINRVPHLGASFRAALEEAGHDVALVDPDCAYTVLDRRPCSWLTRRLLGGRPAGYRRFRGLLTRACLKYSPDVILAVGGCLTPELLQEIRAQNSARRVMYSTDNAFNAVVSPEYVRESLRYWDAIATPRRATIPQLKEHCRGNVFYLPFAYNPALHYPEAPLSEAESAKFRSDVAFLGGCDRDRVPYLDPLARTAEWKVAFYGGYYGYTAAIERRHKGMAYGREYRLALGGTKVALCLVRKANSDSHVMRTFEAPACGAFMMAERTADHEEIFKEDREAVFFASPEEMLDKTRFYVTNENPRRRIAQAGHEKITAAGNTYTDRIRTLLQLACQ